MEETLSLPVNMPFDKRAVCTKSGHEPLNWWNVSNYPIGKLNLFISIDNS